MIHYANPCEREDCRAMREILNRAEIDSFIEGVKLEAAHQLTRWGTEQDRNKGPEEWYWLVGYLAGKALQAQRADDEGKFMHHLISTAAVLANWHYFASNPEPVEFRKPRPTIEELQAILDQPNDAVAVTINRDGSISTR